MKPIIFGLFLLARGLSAQLAPGDQHVAWKLSVEPAAAPAGGKVLVRMSGHIDDGWHLYSMSTPAAIPTKIQLAPSPAIAKFRALQPQPKRTFDANFNSDTETYEGDVAFLLELELKKDAPAGAAELSFSARYQTCNPKMCVPSKWTGTATLTVDPAAAVAAVAIPTGYSEPQAPAPVASSTGAAPAEGLLGFLAVAFGFGLASIFTPCVFPMIPITMSYFLNRESGGRRESIVQALVFCLGIVVLFSGLGLATTAILGPFGIVTLGSNPWVNAFISALFIAFGLSLLGAFEITIPSVILTRLHHSSNQGGFLGSLLMGLTFSLASFACVGPFVGTLLAASVSGGKTRPLVGMVTFATGLALPFFLLAVFPSYLKRMPRSGGWMARVKVVMGFVILAASLKYLSSLDQVLQLGWLTRERFLAAWIVLFAMAGLYLLGFLRLEGIKPDEHMGLGRLLSGIAFLIFAISLLPGMFGGKLGDLDAYVPLGTQSAGIGGSGGESALVWMKNQYREALDRARREGKLVLVDFTGYACTNCHWMKANMFTRPEIAAAMKNFVLVELYTDGTDAESEANQKVQLAKFHTVAIPYYAIVDADEKVLATFPGSTGDAAEYLAFLNKPAPPAAVTAAAPPSALPQASKLEGGSIDTAALSGKVVVVNFWATWCVPCIQEIPGFNRLHKDFAGQGVAVLGISMDDEGAARVQPFLKKHPMDYPVGVGSEALSKRYNLDELPVTLVFDRTGKQVKRFEGFTKEADILAAVRQAL
ncbi:MAG: cytochrome c biogenesis protein CcdA [Candidatus Solibacter sp.]|jgi:thiol:disulfide interchange protein DsbD